MLDCKGLSAAQDGTRACPGSPCDTRYRAPRPSPSTQREAIMRQIRAVAAMGLSLAASTRLARGAMPSLQENTP
jgi:hypothetical protein